MINPVEDSLVPIKLTPADIVREEFWFVAKAFFAPVYGALLVLRHLMGETQIVDSNAQDVHAKNHLTVAAE